MRATKVAKCFGFFSMPVVTGPAPIGALRQDHVRVLRRFRADREEAVDRIVGHVLVEEVAVELVRRS